MTTTDMGPALELPQSWPTSLSPRVLAGIDLPTPFLVGDLAMLREPVPAPSAALPGVQPFYAVKCNSTQQVLRTVAADRRELRGRVARRAAPAAGDRGRPGATCSTATPSSRPRTSPGQPRRGCGGSRSTRRASCTRSPSTPRAAPSTSGCASTTAAASSRCRASSAPRRMRRAPCCTWPASLGLQPVRRHVPRRLAVHRRPARGCRPSPSVGRLMRQLSATASGSRCWTSAAASRRGTATPSRPSSRSAGRRPGRCDELLPYRPALVAAEPGRHLVAETAVMVATVLGREVRAGEEWLYLDVGAYNGLMETQQTVGQWRFPLWSSRAGPRVVSPQVPFTRDRPDLRQRRHDVLRGVAAGDPGRGRPPLRRLRRRLHAELRVALQRVPAAAAATSCPSSTAVSPPEPARPPHVRRAGRLVRACRSPGRCSLLQSSPTTGSAPRAGAAPRCSSASRCRHRWRAGWPACSTDVGCCVRGSGRGRPARRGVRAPGHGRAAARAGAACVA